VNLNAHFLCTGKLATEQMNPPVKFSAFFPLKNTGFYREEDEAELLSYQFLLVSQAAYLYNHKAVLAVSGEYFGLNTSKYTLIFVLVMVIYTNRNLCSISVWAAFNEEPDTIEFLGPGDRVLGGAVCGNVAVFFSKIHGLVSVLPSDFSPHDLNR
jgi:hypothetical protein